LIKLTSKIDFLAILYRNMDFLWIFLARYELKSFLRGVLPEFFGKFFFVLFRDFHDLAGRLKIFIVLGEFPIVGKFVFGKFFGKFLGNFRALGQREYKVIRLELCAGRRDAVNVGE
jgi:hypothetical protein